MEVLTFRQCDLLAFEDGFYGIELPAVFVT